MINIKELAHLEEVIYTYRNTIHMNPETGFEEYETTKFIQNILESKGYKIENNPLDTGVIATINNQYSKTVMLRADIDALNMVEENEVPYISKVDGKMHACGHDAHTAMLLGAALYFADNLDKIKGRIKLVFQPAEEGPLPGGASHLVKAGIMDDVDAVFGLHITTLYETGQVHVKPGHSMSAPDELLIKVSGQGTHASAPESGNDVVLCAANIIQHLQQIVSREIAAYESAVVSISTIHAGTAFNVLPDEVVMTGTVRTFNEDIRRLIHKRIKEVVKYNADLSNATSEVIIKKGYPALINDPVMTDFIVKTASESIGKENVIIDKNPSMGAEDFAYYLQKKPGCFYWIGGRPKDMKEIYYNHNPKFDVDKKSLIYGTLLHINAVLNYFSQND